MSQNSSQICTTIYTTPIFWIDDIPPVVDYCPPDIYTMASKSDTVMFVTWALPRVSDNSGKPVKVSASAMPGIFVLTGATCSVIYIFTDESGNQATCSFNVIIDGKICKHCKLFSQSRGCWSTC